MSDDGICGDMAAIAHRMSEGGSVACYSFHRYLIPRPGAGD